MQHFGFIPTSGIDDIDKSAIQYGLNHRLFTQADVDGAQVQYREYNARQALGFVPTSGVDGIAPKSREGLQYGLKHKLFTQADVDGAQKIYEASRRK